MSRQYAKTFLAISAQKYSMLFFFFILFLFLQIFILYNLLLYQSDISYIGLSGNKSNLSITGWIIEVSVIWLIAQSFFPASLLDAPQW